MKHRVHCLCLFVCKMCIRINGAAQLVDILHHFSHSIDQLLSCRGLLQSSTLPLSPSVPYVRDVRAALINMLAFRVRFHVSVLYYYVRKQLLLSARLSRRNSVCPSICSSVCPSVTWVDQSKTVQARITKSLCRLPGRPNSPQTRVLNERGVGKI